MYIDYSNTGRISRVGITNTATGVHFKGDFPSDFYQTFSKGKYLFIDGEIVLNSAWSEENNEVVSLPEDAPHRQVLLDEGISSIQELQEIEDKTSINGIGASKASDINEYLLTQNNED